MKLLSFTILIVFSCSSYAIEFYRCVDSKGQSHFTNLPKSSLDSNCAAKDRYALMFDQDYQNLSNEYAKYEANTSNSADDSETFSIEGIKKVSVDSVKQSVIDAFDPDKAFDQLMESTEDRDDVFTRAMRGRSKGIESITE